MCGDSNEKAHAWEGLGDHSILWGKFGAMKGRWPGFGQTTVELYYCAGRSFRRIPHISITGKAASRVTKQPPFGD